MRVQYGGKFFNKEGEMSWAEMALIASLCLFILVLVILMIVKYFTKKSKEKFASEPINTVVAAYKDVSNSKQCSQPKLSAYKDAEDEALRYYLDFNGTSGIDNALRYQETQERINKGL